MKPLTNILFLILAMNASGQTIDQKIKWTDEILENADLSAKEYKDSITQYDFSSLWTFTDNSLVYGFIGDNYQRIQIKITSVSKDKKNLDIYHVIGKSKVKNDICQFSGTLKIKKARLYKNMHWGIDEEYKNRGIKKQGILIAQYDFSEDSTHVNAGIFEGLLSTSWLLDRNGRLRYDDIEKNSDSYCNNQFVGSWKGYKNNYKKVCNWGDYRIPISGDLDIGAGEFSPADKYLQFGWQIYRDAYINENKKAILEEEKKWWK